MKDLTCPYCKYEYNHDGDFECLDANNRMTEWCPECNKAFYTYVDFDPCYSEGYKAPCENGEDHEWESKGLDIIDFKVCKHCSKTKWVKKENE